MKHFFLPIESETNPHPHLTCLLTVKVKALPALILHIIRNVDNWPPSPVWNLKHMLFQISLKLIKM